MVADEEIKRDIKGFQERVEKAKARLLALSPKYDTPETRWKRSRQRRACDFEIAHVRKLLAIAEEALAEKVQLYGHN